MRRRKIFLQRHQQAHEARRLLRQRRIKKLQRAPGSFEVTRFSQQMAEALQGEGRDAVAGRRGIVVAGLGAVDEFFVVVAGEEKAALLLILELLQQHIGERAGKLQV